MENGGFTTREVTQSTQDCLEEFELYLKSLCTIKDQCRLNNNQPNMQPALENNQDAIKDFESLLRSACITKNSATQLSGENHEDPIKDFEVILQSYLVSTNSVTQRNDGGKAIENSSTYDNNYFLRLNNDKSSAMAVPEEVENNSTCNYRKRRCDDMYPAEVTDHNYAFLKRSREIDDVTADIEVKTTTDESKVFLPDYQLPALIDELYTEQVLNCNNLSTMNNIKDTAKVTINPADFITTEQLIRELQIVANQPEFESIVTEISNNYTVTLTNDQPQDFVTLEQLQFEIELIQNLNNPIQNELDGNKNLYDDQNVAIHNEFLNGNTDLSEIPFNSLGSANLLHFDGVPIPFNDRKSAMLLEKLFPEDELRKCEESDGQEEVCQMLDCLNDSYSEDEETDSNSDEEILLSKPSTSLLKGNKKEIKENVPLKFQIPMEYAKSSKDSEENGDSMTSKTIITRLCKENIKQNCTQSKKSFIKCNFSPNLQISTEYVQMLSQSNNLEVTTKSNKASKTNPPKCRKEQIPKQNKENIPQKMNITAKSTKNVYNNTYFPAKNLLKTNNQRMSTKSNKASKTNPPKCRKNYAVVAKNSKNDNFYMENDESNAKNKTFKKQNEKNNKTVTTIQFPEASGISIQNSARNILEKVMLPKNFNNDNIPIKNLSNDYKIHSKSTLSAKNEIVTPKLQMPMQYVKNFKDKINFVFDDNCNVKNNTFKKHIENINITQQNLQHSDSQNFSVQSGTHNIVTNVMLPKNLTNNNSPVVNLSKMISPNTRAKSNKASKTNTPMCKKDHTLTQKNENVAPNLQIPIQYANNSKDEDYFYMGNEEGIIRNDICEKHIENDKITLLNRQLPEAPEFSVQKDVEVKEFVVRINLKGEVKPKINVNSDYYPHLIDLSNFITEKLQVIKEFQIRTVNKMVYGKEGTDASENLLENINSTQEEYEELLESQEFLSQQSVSFTPDFVDFTALKLSTDESQNQNDPKSKQRLSTALNDIFNDMSLINQEGAQELNVPAEISARIVLRKIALVLYDVLDDINAGVLPEFRVSKRDNWDNVMFSNNRLIPKPAKDSQYCSVKYLRVQSRNKFVLIVQLLGKIIDLIIANMTCSKRELYYQLIKFAKHQRQIDSAITAITSLIGTPSWEFGVHAASKGLVYGNLSLYFENGEVNSCLISGGLKIPFNLRHLIKIETNASFIIIVEKDAVFQKLLTEDLPNKLAYPFILVTGKGFADITTRLFVKKIWQAAAIPVFILVDCDPFGIEIMLTYRFGSLGQAHLSDHLALPQLRWLGLHPSELVAMGVETLPMANVDREKLDQLLTRPFINAVPKIRQELEILKNRGVKAEIEGVMKSINFLGNFYLPIKLYDKNYI